MYRMTRSVRVLFSLLHFNFRRLQEGSVLLLFLSFSFCLEMSPAVHTPITGLLKETEKNTAIFPPEWNQTFLKKRCSGAHVQAEPQSSSATLSLSLLAPESQSPPLSASFCKVRETHSQSVSITADTWNTQMCVCVSYLSCMSFASRSFLLISSSAKSFIVCL